MKIAIGFAAAATLLAQAPILSPNSEFNLAPAQKTHRKGEMVRSYFRAGPAGLTFVEIGQKFVSLSSADLNGQIVYSTGKLASVEIPASKAVFPPDGSIWLVSSPAPRGFDAPVTNVMNSYTPPRINMAAQTVQANSSFEIDAFGPSGSYLDLARYSPMGKRLESVRLARPAGVGSETLMAVSGDALVLRTSGRRVGVRAFQPEGLQFGSVVQGKFRESTGFHLDPPVTNAIPILLANGDLLLVHRDTGNMDVIDPNLKKSTLARLSNPAPVQAAAADGNYLYLLSYDAVLKTDLTGQVLATFRFQLSSGFEPAFVGVTGNFIYLVNKHGHAKRFEIN